MDPLLFVTFLVFLAVLVLFVGLHRALGWTREVEAQFEQRFAPASYGQAPSHPIGQDIEQILAKTSRAKRLQIELNLADINLTVAEYLLVRMALAGGGLILGTIISGQLLGGVLSGVVMLWLPRLYIRRRQDKRTKLFNNQLPDVVNLLVSSLRAGYGLRHALTVVVEEMPDPSAKEFGRVMREILLGYSLDDALGHLVERNRSDDLELLVTAIQIQNDVGGSLADTLETISSTIRDRILINGEIRTLTAQQRFSGTILAGLPFLLATALTLLNPEYMMELFQPGWPILIPIAVVIMVACGYIIMQRMLTIDF